MKEEGTEGRRDEGTQGRTDSGTRGQRDGSTEAEEKGGGWRGGRQRGEEGFGTMMNLLLVMLLALVLLPCASMAGAGAQRWKEVFRDSGEADWTQKWFLDGDKATVNNTPAGLVFRSGPVGDDNAGHAVLWTVESFQGDLRVEYDFERLDHATDHTAVCILYLQATGVGTVPYSKDIADWRELRRRPAMNLYFNHMNCYHISYACSGGRDRNYVRARRYPAKGNFDATTRIPPSYENVEAFKPGETWHMVAEKIGVKLSFTATKGEQRHTWTWDAAGYPPVTAGRIGLRQMHGRESRYTNFTISIRP